jgi:site-specific DNA-methyltransferase (cytosine-N4-specific)
VREPCWHDKTATLYLGDAREVLKEMADRSVDCIVTSLPPWTPDHTQPPPSPGYGREPTPALYIAALRRVFVEAHRVLTDTGTAWLAISDQYALGTGRAYSPRGKHSRIIRDESMTGLPVSSLIGLPWQLAFALNDDGWIIRNSIVSHRPVTGPGTLPEDRFASSYELIFLLVKQPRYHFDAQALRRTGADSSPARQRPAVWQRQARRRAGRRGNGNSVRAAGNCRSQYAAATAGEPHAAAAHSGGRPPADVWAVPAARQQDRMPIEVPLSCIAAGCRPGGTVLDMFAGTAVTGLAARALGRSFIGIEETRALCDGAARALQQDTDPGEAP